MFYTFTKIYYIWIVYSNSGYIPHYGPDSLLLAMTTSEMGIFKQLVTVEVFEHHNYIVNLAILNPRYFLIEIRSIRPYPTEVDYSTQLDWSYKNTFSAFVLDCLKY